MSRALYDLPTVGKDHGAGTFAEGTVTKIEGGYHVDASSEYGRRYACYLDVVFTDYKTEPDMVLHSTMDVADMDFRLIDDKLHLRKSEEQ